MTQKHTHYRLVPSLGNEESNVCIVDSKNRRVAMVRDFAADHFLRAANAHEALVEACKKALDNLKDRDADDGETGEQLRTALHLAGETT